MCWIFDVDGYEPIKTGRYYTAFIIGDDGYFKSVSFGESPNVGKYMCKCIPLIVWLIFLFSKKLD